MILQTANAFQRLSNTWRMVQNQLEKHLLHLTYIGKKSSSLIVCHGLRFESQGVSWHIPKYMFLGVRGSGVPIKVGIYAGFSAEGLNLSIAVSKFTASLENRPASTKDYALFIYPVTNPRSSRDEFHSPDDFWHHPDSTEAQYLEQESKKNAFHAQIHILVSPSNVATTSTSSALLGAEVLKPALQAIQHLLPIRSEPIITSAAFDGKHPNREKSFDIALHLPTGTPYEILIPAVDTFIRETLQNYRSVISHAQNI